MLGVMFALHSDNKGLVLPPKIAPNKIVIIPILFDKTKEKVLKEAEKIKKELSKFQPILDDREDYSPGWKYAEWELKGIPLRIEIGPKDLEKNEVVLVRRDNSAKKPVKTKGISKVIEKELREMQDSLFKKAQKLLYNNLTEADNLQDALKELKENKIVLVPLKNSKEVEDILKEKTKGAKTLNMPLKQPTIKGKKCIISGEQANYWVYIGKSY